MRIVLPPLFAERAGGAAELSLEAATLLEAVERLGAAHPDLHPLLFDREGEFNDFLVIFRNGERVEASDVGKTSLDPGDELVLVSAVEGG